jgi:hypothetical protein
MSTDMFGNSIVYNDKIYVIWGKTRIYDTVTGEVSFGAPEPVALPSTSGGDKIGITIGFMAPTRIYVFSGTTNQVYDPQANSWTTGSAIPISRGDFAVAVVDDLIYVIGGVSVSYEGRPQGSGGAVTYYATVEQYTPFGYGKVPPIIDVVSPENRSFTSSEVQLNVTVNRAFEWMRYCLDGKANVTVTGNITLTGLSNGLHNLTVYAEDEFGNIGASKTITFTTSGSFSNALIVAVYTVTVMVACVGIILYLRKKKR